MAKVFLKPGSLEALVQEPVLHPHADAALMLAENMHKWPAEIVVEMLWRNKTPLRLCMLAMRLEREDQIPIEREALFS